MRLELSDTMTNQVLAMIPSDTRKTIKLASTRDVVINDWYELTIDVDVTGALASGAGETVTQVRPVDDGNIVAGVIWLLFDGPKVGVEARIDNRHLYQRNIETTWTPIQPVARQFEMGRGQAAEVLRKQFPIKHAAAKTIHGSQGDSVDKVVVELLSTWKEPYLH
jgi:hypothetical protein